jgi:nucleotide-binding universal stress UspA family protein
MSTAPVPISVAPAIHLKNILFTTDFSESSRGALRYAEALAGEFGARISLCHAMTPKTLAISAPEAAPYLYEAEYECSEREMANLLRAEEEKGLNIDAVLQSGPLKDVLLTAIAEKNIDLVVTSTHGRTGVRRLLLGSSAEEICRSARCPVLTVGPWLLGKDKIQFRRILVPTDLSEESMRVLSYALGIAQEYGSEVTALNVIELDTAASSDMKTAAKSKALAMKAIFRHKLTPFKHEFLVDFGDAAETILRVSREKKADLIALGIRNAFAGPQLRSSIAYRIMVGANCPVLTCR